MNSGSRISKIYKVTCFDIIMINKRGLSQIVTTILMILIVISAIAIIFAAIRPAIESASKEITTDCFTISMEIESCSIGDFDGEADNSDVQITVKRNPGKGKLNGLKFLFDTGNVLDGDSTNLPDELETKVYTFLDQSSLPAEVDVAFVVGEGEKICDPSRNPIKCA